MTLDEFCRVQGRTYRRAREWQVTFNNYANAVEEFGCKGEAVKLRAIGERVWIIAEIIVDKAFEKMA